ncbi:MAG TPA: PLP-dependent aminotransferase family protein [Methylomirabilota bacterium]|nr:PLP-dependent aminotransferase family protein [Methylomirabilota bacterium]
MTTSSAQIVPFVPFVRPAAGPLYRQIYDGYRAAILSGRLRPGQRLPSTRALAAELEISRLPALNAFEQLLHEGYIEGKVGAGTYVAQAIPDDLTRPADGRAAETRGRAARPAPRDEGGLGPFRVSVPALDQFPHRIWARLLWRHAKRPTNELMAYGDPAGHVPLREAIAEYLRTARGVRAEAAHVLIVSGSQMALQICARALLAPGDSVCMEEPGYPGARDALGAVPGARLVPVPLDDEGIDVGRLAAAGRRARLVYVTPSHQYPLGIAMTAARRLALLRWARGGARWIIEDDYDSEYRYASRPLAALQGMDAAARVIYVGTFSKVLFPSLRVGYVVVPPALWDRFVRLREGLDIFSPTLPQAVLADFLAEGHFARHLRRMRKLYQGRRDALVGAVRRELGDLVTIVGAEAGLHLSVLLPPGVDDREVLRRAAAGGVTGSTLTSCYAGRRRRSGLILGFGGSDEGRLREAMATLAGVIRALA